MEQPFDVARQNSARSQFVAISGFSKEWLTSEAFACMLDSLFERQMLERMQRVVMDENADRALGRQQVRHFIDDVPERVLRSGFLHRLVIIAILQYSFLYQ